MLYKSTARLQTQNNIDNGTFVNYCCDPTMVCLQQLIRLLNQQDMPSFSQGR